MTVSETAAGPLPVRIAPRVPAELPRERDAVVIGGGITGLLTAIELRTQGRSVLLLEARNIGNAQSGRNMGFVREQGRESVEGEIMRHAADRWRTLAERYGQRLGWTAGGHLSVARDEESLDRVASWGGIAERIGTRFEVLRGRAAAERFPWLAPGIVGIGWTPDDGHVDPAPAMRTIAELAREVGVEIVEGAEVDRLELAGGRIEGVAVGERTVRSPLVVLAAGVWSSRLLRRAGIGLPLHVGRSTLSVTRPVAPLTRSSVWDVTGAGFRQSSDGRIVVGMGAFVDVDVRWEDVRASLSLLPVLWQNRRTMRIHPGRPLAGDLADLVTGKGLRPFEWSEAEPNARTAAEGCASSASWCPRSPASSSRPRGRGSWTAPRLPADRRCVRGRRAAPHRRHERPRPGHRARAGGRCGGTRRERRGIEPDLPVLVPEVREAGSPRRAGDDRMTRDRIPAVKVDRSPNP
ncbi:NAD(P)/FAD-dependent oxidoreductase [Leucobacter soli]|uniref:NAD(P)/FAD-dependent oxidoreductase n=2 Tax=Leucobacter soli TaxID=2812850 RepID=UPI003608C1C3